MTDPLTFYNDNAPNTGVVSFTDFVKLLPIEAEQADYDIGLAILFYQQQGKLVAYYDLECHDGFVSQEIHHV